MKSKKFHPCISVPEVSNLTTKTHPSWSVKVSGKARHQTLRGTGITGGGDLPRWMKTELTRSIVKGFWEMLIMLFIVYFSCSRLPCVFTLFSLVYFVPYFGELLGGTCSLSYLWYAFSHNHHKRFLENKTEKKI